MPTDPSNGRSVGMTAEQIADRTAELVAGGMRRQDADREVHREALALQDAAWRAEDPGER